MVLGGAWVNRGHGTLMTVEIGTRGFTINERLTEEIFDKNPSRITKKGRKEKKKAHKGCGACSVPLTR